MSSHADLVQYIADQCAGAGEIATRKMFRGAFILLFCLAFACKGDLAFGSQPVHNPEITVERLDRAVDFVLSQDPPFITMLVYAVQSNVLVEVWTERDRKSFATALLDAGWKAAAGQSPKSTIVEYGDKRMPDRYSPPEKSRRVAP